MTVYFGYARSNGAGKSSLLKSLNILQVSFNLRDVFIVYFPEFLRFIKIPVRIFYGKCHI